MSGQKRRVTVTRIVDIDVDVGFRPGLAQSWYEPGEPEEWWIEKATDENGDTVELTEAEKDEAVEKAANDIEMGDPGEPDDEPDDDKPF